MEHRFHFKRGDFELSFSGDRDFVEGQLASWLPRLSGETPASLQQGTAESRVLQDPLEAPLPDYPRVSPDFKPRRNISLADLATLKEAVAPSDLVVVAGYYMEKYMQQEAYTPAELQAELVAVPAWDCTDIAEFLPLAVLQGYLQEMPGERYQLTFKGQTYVRDGLS